MKLLTAEIRRKLPPLYAQDGKGIDATAYVKLFHPLSRWTFFAVEFDGEDVLYGYCMSALGHDCDELGYASLSELESLSVMGLGVERDLHWQPKALRAALAELGVEAEGAE